MSEEEEEDECTCLNFGLVNGIKIFCPYSIESVFVWNEMVMIMMMMLINSV